MRTQAETAVMMPQPEECQGRPATMRGVGSSLRLQREHDTLFPDIWPPELEENRILWGFCVCVCYFLFIFFFFETEFRSCYSGWSAMARSRLTTTSASWVQAILLPQPPK